MLHRIFGSDQRHNPAFRRRQIAQQINFENRRHSRSQANRFSGFLGDVRFGKRFQRHHNGGARLAQKPANMFWRQQRIDRANDPSNRAT